MSKGELLQTRKTRKLDIDEEEYYRIISDKTASLISACCEIGAVSATDDRVVQQGLRSYGEELGLAFQIRDDLFDYTGAGSAIGKPVGNDLQEKKAHSPPDSRTQQGITLRIAKDTPTDPQGGSL